MPYGPRCVKQQHLSVGIQRGITAVPVNVLLSGKIPMTVDGVELFHIFAVIPTADVIAVQIVKRTVNGHKPGFHILPYCAGIILGGGTRVGGGPIGMVRSQLFVADEEIVVLRFTQSVECGVIIGQVHVIPFSVNLNQIPRVLHILADRISAGHAHLLEQRLIGEHICLTNPGFLRQHFVSIG